MSRRREKQYREVSTGGTGDRELTGRADMYANPFSTTLNHGLRKAINGNYVFRRHCEESLLKNKTVELRKIWSYFNGEPHVFLATADSDQPRVRPVTLVHLRGKL